MVLNWVAERFSPMWVNECDVAFAHVPISCLIAVEAEQREMIGFTCYDAVYRNFFGPIGVDEAYRGRGIGKALLLKCLREMASQGYAYAIIPWVGPKEFYADLVGAIEIEGSEPGVFRTMLKQDEGGNDANKNDDNFHEHSLSFPAPIHVELKLDTLRLYGEDTEHPGRGDHAERSHQPPTQLFPPTQLLFKGAIEFIPRPSFNPGLVPTILEQNESKILKIGRQRFLHPLSRMRVIVAVDCYHRTVDMFCQFQ
ncbi:GNAT family N-acetyltransferase [Chloroflexota bacterium]